MDTALTPDPGEIAIEAVINLRNNRAMTFFVYDNPDLAMKVLISPLPKSQPCYEDLGELNYSELFNNLNSVLLRIEVTPHHVFSHVLAHGESLPYKSSLDPEKVDYLNELLGEIYHMHQPV